MVTAIGKMFMIKTEPVSEVIKFVTTSSVISNEVSMVEKVLSIAPLPRRVAAMSTNDPSSLANVNR